MSMSNSCHDCPTERAIRSACPGFLQLLWIAMFVLIAMLVGCGRKDVNRHGEIKLRGEPPVSMKRKDPGDFLQKGVASWYGKPFHGRKTASGETYDMWKRTAAHKTLPLGTLVEVRNRDNGRATVVRINDRGPFVRGRIIDLSRRAAEDLGMIGPGTARVKLYLADKKTAGKWEKQKIKPSKSPRETSPPADEEVSDGFWTIQVGAFSDFQKARTMVYRLEAFGERVMIEKSQGLYRVRIGVFESREEATDFCRSLEPNDIPCWVTYANSEE